MNRNNQSFSERMEAAKARLPATAGKHYPRPVRARDYWGDPNSDDMLDAWQSLCNITRRALTKGARRIANDFAAAVETNLTDADMAELGEWHERLD